MLLNEIYENVCEEAPLTEILPEMPVNMHLNELSTYIEWLQTNAVSL